jgi:primosomal protein N' (replication factor Y)
VSEADTRREVCRVLPDVSAVERTFDYLIPDALAADVARGSIVRVRLHGRRVRGWVVDVDVDAAVAFDRLQPLLTVSSVGPPADVVTLCASVAQRCGGPLAAMLRSASPPNNVRPGVVARCATAPGAFDWNAPTDETERAADELAAVAGTSGVLRWPPMADRRRLVGRLLAENGSSIVVTADGGRAAAFHRWLVARGVRSALLHSDVSAASRTDAWRVAAGGACVVVGGRAAVLAPVPDLACGVLLDDGDEALQEERSPTWHARDVLQERLRAAGGASYVVTPAPSAVTMHRAGMVHAPPALFERAGWPRVEVIDRRDDPPGGSLLSERLVVAVQAAVARAQTVVLVLNRRGGVRLLRCGVCHQLTRWDAQGRLVWADRGESQLEMLGVVTDADADTDTAASPRPRFCTHCGATRLVELRGGVQRLATTLAGRLHDTEVAVVDASVVEVPDAPVVVGTEAVLHRDEVRRRRPGLVAFVDFDAELSAPRYRAAEQALWLVVRAARVLATGERAASRVVLQTHDPDHVVVAAAVQGAPQLVTDVELVRRAAFGLPPFGALAELRGDAPALVAAEAALRPFEAAPHEIALDMTEQRLLVRAPDDDTLAAALAAASSAARALGGIRVVADPPRL